MSQCRHFLPYVTCHFLHAVILRDCGGNAGFVVARVQSVLSGKICLFALERGIKFLHDTYQSGIWLENELNLDYTHLHFIRSNCNLV